MIFCQSARVHIPEAMTKSFGRVWVIRQKICEEVPARAKNQEEREEKKEVFVASETHSKKKTRRREEKFTFCSSFFFFHPPHTNFDWVLLRETRFSSKLSFFFSFFQPTWQKKDTRIHAQQNHRNNKSKEEHAREVKKRARSCVFTHFYVAWATHNAQTERVLWAHIFGFFLKRREKFFLRFGEEKKKKLSPTPPSFSLSLSLLFLTFSRKEHGNLTSREKKTTKIWNMSRLVWFVKREHHHSNYTLCEIYSRWIDYDRVCSLFQPECIHTSPFILLSFFSFLCLLSRRRRRERREESKKDPLFLSRVFSLLSLCSLFFFPSFKKKKREYKQRSSVFTFER